MIGRGRSVEHVGDGRDTAQGGRKWEKGVSVGETLGAQRAVLVDGGHSGGGKELN